MMAYQQETMEFEINGAKAPPVTLLYGDSAAEGKYVFASYADSPRYFGKDLEYWKQCADAALTVWLGKNRKQAKTGMLTEANFPPNRMVEYG